ncbi:MAG: hypothetical protein ACE5HT_13630 [Gemmatimonadales bacterium]
MPTPTLPIAVLRGAVERELSQISLRQAAREIGLSPNALRNFLGGSTPRRGTRARMERWLATRPASGNVPTLRRFLRLLENVTPDLPPREAATLGREVSRLLLDAYERQRVPPPRWVRELLRHYRAERPNDTQG